MATLYQPMFAVTGMVFLFPRHCEKQPLQRLRAVSRTELGLNILNRIVMNKSSFKEVLGGKIDTYSVNGQAKEHDGKMEISKLDNALERHLMKEQCFGSRWILKLLDITILNSFRTFQEGTMPNCLTLGIMRV